MINEDGVSNTVSVHRVAAASEQKNNNRERSLAPALQGYSPPTTFKALFRQNSQATEKVPDKEMKPAEYAVENS